MDVTDHVPGEVDNRGIRRRAVLGGLLGTGAVGVALSPTAVAAPSSEAPPIVIDVACLLYTMRLIHAPEITPSGPPSPLYGSPFLVEGRVYAGGALDDREGFDPDGSEAPTVEETLGTWLCRGWMLSRDGRPDPHAATTQLHTFTALSDDPFPPNQLASEGVEGADGPGWSSTRIVLGGTGDFAGARGTVEQTHIGDNATSLVLPGGAIMNGPNFRFTFHLTPEGPRHGRDEHPPANPARAR